MKIIHLEPTPNPNAFKFNLQETLRSGSPASYHSKEEAAGDPLAELLFEVEGMDSVFYLGNFVTVTKKEDVDWEEFVKTSGKILLDFDHSLLANIKEKDPEKAEQLSEEMAKINELLDATIRPALANDGGGVDLLGIDGNTIFIRYQGACGTCPTATKGTLSAIENLLKHKLDPKITVVPA